MKWQRCVSVMAALVLAVSTSAVRGGIRLDMVTVGNVGNANDTTGYGGVDHVYAIGKYEVTAGQYTAFLNAVAATDTYLLYNTQMWSSDAGAKIQRSGSSGSYTYSVAADRASRPVNYVSWGDAARFTNWLHNGQVAGAQGLGTTEDGAYYLNGAMSKVALLAVYRSADAKYWIPTENEWYKAAYHKNDGVTGNYFDYPTGSDTINTTMANYDSSVGHMTDVGAYAYASPYGTFDQGGNVWEWNGTRVSDDGRGVRGGGWNSPSDDLLASTHFDYISPTTQDYHMGFRVASVPEPSSIVLLSCGAIAGLLWWNHKRKN